MRSSSQEAVHFHPEVTIGPDHDDGLDSFAVTLAQSLGQFRVCLFPFGVQPLLKLVQDDQDSLAVVQALP